MARNSRTKANGEGTIYKEMRKGKPYYRGQLTIGRNKDGSLKRKSFSSYERKEVVRKMNEYLYKLNVGLLPTDDDLTLQQWFHTWLFNYRIHDLKPSSFERYEGIYRNYIYNSPIGKLKLIDLRTRHIQSYYNDLLDNGKSPSTIHTINQFLQTCLESALSENYITKNYCKYVNLPKKDIKKGYTVLTLEEQNKFLEAVQGHKYEMAFKLALGTGLRLGELLALKWNDIDINNKTLNVNKSNKRVTIINRDGERKNKLIEQSPKTESSIRTIPIPNNIFDSLKKYRKEQLKTKKKYEEFYNDNGYIFCDKFGNPLDPKRIPRNFKSVLKKANIRDMKFHSLRHTYATRLFEVGVPIKTVQVLMGHSDITTTMNIYTHVMPEQKSKAVNKINELF